MVNVLLFVITLFRYFNNQISLKNCFWWKKCLDVAIYLYYQFRFLDGRVYEAPSKLIYRLIGSDVVFTWCVSSSWQDERPTVTFYLKEPVAESIPERTIATVSSERVVEKLPATLVHKTLFLRSQIDVYVTNCMADGAYSQLTNYSLAIRNLSISQTRFYEISVNYLIAVFGRENGTHLKVVGMLKALRIFSFKSLSLLSLVYTGDISISTRSIRKQSMISPLGLAKIKQEFFFVSSFVRLLAYACITIIYLCL